MVPAFFMPKFSLNDGYLPFILAMVNYNGQLVDGSAELLNRGLLYGDGVFETMKVKSGRVLFLEDHYFRLMAAMRVCRMEIPMHFTMEYLDEQIALLLEAHGLDNARVRLTIYRTGRGYYTPLDQGVSFVMTASELAPAYDLHTDAFQVDLYKDFFVPAQLLSTIKTTNRMVNVLAGVFASENGLDSCLMMNEKRNIVEAIEGNVFLVSGRKLTTPPLSEGCLNGIMRKQILSMARNAGMEVNEVPVSPFELQQADEMFITNVIRGIRPVSLYRKKEYTSEIAQQLAKELQNL